MSETRIRDPRTPSAPQKAFNVKIDGLSLFRDLSKEKLKSLARFWREQDYVVDLDYRAILLHYFDYRYKDETNWGNESIPFVQHEMVNYDSYDAFRRKYIMYFDPSGQNWT